VSRTCTFPAVGKTSPGMRCLSHVRKAPAFAASILSVLALAAVTHADRQRERPWPDEWPIALPPIDGPLPPAPPALPPAEPATRSAARVVEWVDRVHQNLRSSRYQHHLAVNERTGTYNWDCSLMAEWILQRAAPRSVRHMEGGQRALAQDFVRAIERAPTSGYRRGWQRLAHIEEVRPGDVFAWRRPPGFPSRNTGHVGFALERPRPVPQIPNAYALRVADSTRSLHQDDTRSWPSEGGFGIGTLVFLTDGRGNGTHYGWAGTYSEGYVITPILFARVGP
jgi:hypothetical protein